MAYKERVLFCFVVFLTVLAPFSSYSNETTTEVILTVKEGKILAFSAYKSHWVPVSLMLTERVIEKKSQGNIGIVVTNKRMLGFSVLLDQWTSEDLKMNEHFEEVTVEGNVAIVRTGSRIIGYSAHTGQWAEAPL